MHDKTSEQQELESIEVLEAKIKPPKKGLEYEMNLVISNEPVISLTLSKINKVKNKVKLDGFRKGKTPTNLIIKRYGSGFYQEAIYDIAIKAYFKTLDKHKDLSPIEYPRFEGLNFPFEESILKEADKKIKFIAKFEVLPKLDLKNLNKLKLQKLAITPTEKDIEEIYNKLKLQKTEFVELDTKNRNNTKAISGNQVIVDFTGYVKDKKFDGSEGKDVAIILGSNTMIKDFEEAIIGMKISQTTKAKLSFPENYTNKELANKKVTFEITLKDIKVAKGEVKENEEFFKSCGIESGKKEDLLAQIKNNLEQESLNIAAKKNADNVFDILKEKYKVEIPNLLVEREVQSKLEQEKEKKKKDPLAITPPAYTKLDADNSDPRLQEYRDEAKDSIKMSLIVQKLIEDLEIKASESELDAFINKEAEQFDAQQKDQFVSWYKSQPKILEQIKSKIIEDKLITKILDIANVKKVTKSYTEYLKS